MSVDPIRLALPSKGHLCDGALALLRTAGYPVRRSSERQYEATISGHPRFHVVFMRPTDIVDQVCEGRCHLGITGMDVYAEHRGDDGVSRVVIEDLGYGGCRLVVAVPENWIDVTHVLDLVDLSTEFKASGRSFRISTKYPQLVRGYLRRWGMYYYQLIASDGALELHPSLGISDIIVDLTSSGSTLKDNRLREIEAGTVLKSAACLIGHGPGLATLVDEGESGPLALLLDAIDGVRGSESLRHLEVVGTPRSGGTGAEVAQHLREVGGLHVCHGEVWTAGAEHASEPGWRVTALVPARIVPGLRRPLLARGAARMVVLATQSVFDRDESSTFDRLRVGLNAS